MGGKISVQSEVGRGSLFTVRIPRVTIVGDESPIPTTGYNTPSYTPPSEVQSLLEEKEEKPLFKEGKRVRTKRTVLLVEDNISLLNSLSKKLSRSYNVFGFVSAEQAADFLQREEVDIVISDIMLPGKSGKEFCAEIKSNLTPVTSP